MGFSLFGSSGSKKSSQSTTTTTTSGAFDVSAFGDANVTQYGSGSTVMGLTGKDLSGLYDYANGTFNKGVETVADLANKGVETVSNLATGVTDLTKQAFDKSTETTIEALKQVQEAWRRSQSAQVNVQETLAPYVKMFALVAAIAVFGVVFAGKRK